MPPSTSPRDSASSAPAVLAWRMGLGWLVGRRWVLLTTITAEGDLRRSVERYVFAGGDLYVAPSPDAAWVGDVVAKPQVMAQAAPGPLATRAEPVAAALRPRVRALFAQAAPELAERPETWWIRLAAGGDRAPDIVAPDWAWAGIAALAATPIILRGSRKRRASIGRRGGR